MPSKSVKQARLMAERDFAAVVKLPARLLSREKNPVVADILRKERELFLQRRHSINFQIEILNRQIAEANQEIAATEQQVRADEAGLKAMSAELKSNDALVEKGFVSQARMLGLQRAENVVESEDHIATLCEVMRYLILS